MSATNDNTAAKRLRDWWLPPGGQPSSSPSGR
jgi:hypothetical protein